MTTRIKVRLDFEIVLARDVEGVPLALESLAWTPILERGLLCEEALAEREAERAAERAARERAGATFVEREDLGVVVVGSLVRTLEIRRPRKTRATK